MSWHTVLWEISYVNLVMLNQSIPNYDSKDKEVKNNGTLSGADLFKRLKGK